jgi:hypothetical protein
LLLVVVMAVVVGGGGGGGYGVIVVYRFSIQFFKMGNSCSLLDFFHYFSLITFG